MKAFEDYFSFDALLGDLVQWRVAGNKGVGSVLPPRKSWMRDGYASRKKMSPKAVRHRAIVRRVNYERARGTMDRDEWGQKLAALVANIQSAVIGGSIKFEPPRIIQVPKGRKEGVMEYRNVASFERLEDRLILSRATAYVRDVLEDVLHSNCYSFRVSREVSHKKAIADLQSWRKRFAAEEMWVSECDIKKFFDNISHDSIKLAWRMIDVGKFDPRVERILDAYLDVYSSSEGVNRGIPQGGSFSTVLANLVLHEADSTVLNDADDKLFYARYCDDVIIVSSDKEDCARAMQVYAQVLRAIDLEMHPIMSFEYLPGDDVSTKYYSIKSKGPFAWRNADVNEADVAPWISFLGCHIKFNGDTRIRKESIEKHKRSLGQETAKAIRSIKRGELSGVSLANRRAWFARFRNRLIAKGVGYVTQKVSDCDMWCWAGAFPHVTICKETEMQMRMLDRVREGLLSKVWRMVSESFPESNSETRHKFKGRPYSYYAFLHKAVRPSNMAFLRRAARTLPYSEL